MWTSAPFVLLALVVCVWFWPVTLFGKLPTGGDISSLHLPLLTHYQHALEDGRVPLWNEQLGFGTPVLAEGQVGVLSPVNQVLYRFFTVHNAFTVGLLFHFVLAAWFTYLCARGFELSRPAAVLAGIVFIGQGFFVGRLTQQWSYTTGCWLPLAVLCAFEWLSEKGWRWLLGLVLVLAVQLLAGHFQIAFYTQVVVVALPLVVLLSTTQGRAKIVFKGVLLWLAPVAAAALAAAQLIPTAELVTQADPRSGGFDFLASFAMPPLHLVNYLAPTLLQQHPLWEPIAWIPHRTIGGECLTYVGLLPLGLAIWSIRFGQTDRNVRIWSILLCASIALSLGPSLPGFSLLVKLPGFGWFSAPSRWSIVSGLFLALLAGRGLERIDPTAFCRWSRYYIVIAGVLLLLCVTGLVVYARATASFDQRPDQSLASKLLDHGYTRHELLTRRVTPSGELPDMLFQELRQPLLHWGLLLIAGCTSLLSAGRHRFTIVVIGWTIVDLGAFREILGRVDYQPRHWVVTHSPALAEIKKRSSHRVAGTIGNLPLLVGASSFAQTAVPDMQHYWEIGRHVWPESLPTVPHLTRWNDFAMKLGYLQSPDPIRDDEVTFLRLSDIRLLVLGSAIRHGTPASSLRHVKDETDRWLTAQRFGPSSLKLRPHAWRWAFWELRPEVTSARAWLFPIGSPPAPGTDPRLVVRPPPARRRMLDRAKPLEILNDQGELVEVSGTSETRAVLVLSDLHYPGWNAFLTQSGTPRRVEIQRAFGDWRAVVIPQAGPFRITFKFQPQSFRVGWRISLATAILWLVAWTLTFTCNGRQRKTRGDAPANRAPLPQPHRE